MRAYTPERKQLPPWMAMNTASKHLMKSSDVDMEYTQEQIEKMDNRPDADDALFRSFLDQCSISSENYWAPINQTVTDFSSQCTIGATLRPEFKIKHAACDRNALGVIRNYEPPFRNPYQKGCHMYNWSSKEVYPEYAKCLKAGGMDALDCQKACYAYPDQVGCESIKAIVDKMTPEQRKQKLIDIRFGEGLPYSGRPGTTIYPPGSPLIKPDDDMVAYFESLKGNTVVVAASMKTVSPSAIQISYVDPKTKKPVVVKKTLADLYKPTDKVSVILGKKTNKFIGLAKK